MGPFEIGERPVFECPITGTFAKVNVVVRFPNDDVWAFEAHQDSDDPDMWLCSDMMAFESGESDWYTMRWNCYTNTSDTTPVRAFEFWFLVRDSGANQDFYYEV